jgi:hypothetical protein
MVTGGGVFWSSRSCSALAGGFHVLLTKIWAAVPSTMLTFAACVAMTTVLICFVSSAASRLGSFCKASIVR